MRTAMFVRSCLLAATLVPALAVASDALVSLPRTAQYDITSKGNGEAYRVVVAVPPGYDKEKAYPAIFVLESNVYFATAVDALDRQANFKVAAPAIVVGIGYPSDDPQVGLVRRWYDLTITPNPKEKRRNGGGDDFIKFIEDEVKPLVYGRYKIDKARQALWGHSNGGLVVMRAMFRNPESYAAFAISSPNIGWNDSVVLKDEAAFVENMKKPGKPIRVMVSHGSEDYPAILKMTPQFGDRLAAAGADRINLHRQVFDGEGHISVSHIALVRALRFALPPDAAPR
jgi:uncharacterized protein